MKRPAFSRPAFSPLAGQVAIEYLIGFALMTWVFFAGDPSLIQMLMRAFQSRFSTFSWEISLP